MPLNPNARLTDNAPSEISDDRRTRRRYPLDLAVQFKVMKNYLVTHTGAGRTLNLSSKGIAFQSTEMLKPGAYVEVSVSWPVLLNQSCPMKLVVSGRVVRSNGDSIAICMDRYEFRTQGSRALQADAAQQIMAAGLR